MSVKTSPALGRQFARIVQQMNIKREFLSDRAVKAVAPGGFPYEAFNGKAQITPWSLLRMVEFSRGMSFNKFKNDERCYLDFDRLYMDRLMFINGTKTEVSPEMYDHDIPKGPVEMLVELDNVGKTSVVLKTSVFLPGLSTPACVSYVQSVFVGLEKRQPSQPPDWWMEKYATGFENKTPFRLQRHSLPESGFLTDYQLRISASDLDPYWHTNWTNFVRFSYDAFINHGVAKHGHSNLARGFRAPKSFTVLYFKEARLGDVLDVRIFKEPDNAHLFKFQFKKGLEVVCDSTMELYPHTDE